MPPPNPPPLTPHSPPPPHPQAPSALLFPDAMTCAWSFLALMRKSALLIATDSPTCQHTHNHFKTSGFIASL